MVKGSRSGSNEGDPAPQGWAGQGDVWIVDLGSGQTTVLPGLSIGRRTVPQFTDMGWSPDDTKLALAYGQISLYFTLTDRLETLESSRSIG